MKPAFSSGAQAPEALWMSADRQSLVANEIGGLVLGFTETNLYRDNKSNKKEYNFFTA
ncbi:MAG: hypothetical protein H7328_02850 [Bdellovibrio sp.]|nr:hypothetical protein [Bdellovibrio sp.]